MTAEQSWSPFDLVAGANLSVMNFPKRLELWLRRVWVYRNEERRSEDFHFKKKEREEKGCEEWLRRWLTFAFPKHSNTGFV